MWTVYGKRLFGTCEVVPELFYVATMFFHINYVPLVPLGSFVVMKNASARNESIGLNYRSMLLAWLRAGSFLLAFGTGIYMLIIGNVSLDVRPKDFIAPTAVIVAALLACYFLMVLPRIKLPTYERACELAKIMYLNEKEMAALNVKYGRDALGNVVGPISVVKFRPWKISVSVKRSGST